MTQSGGAQSGGDKTLLVFGGLIFALTIIALLAAGFVDRGTDRQDGASEAAETWTSASSTASALPPGDADKDVDTEAWAERMADDEWQERAAVRSERLSARIKNQRGDVVIRGGNGAPDNVSEEDQQAFVLELSASAPSVYSNWDDETLIRYGFDACRDLDAGVDPYTTALNLASRLDEDPVEMAGLVGAATGALCVEHYGVY